MKFAGDFLPIKKIVRNGKTKKCFSQEGGFIARWRGTEEQNLIKRKITKNSQRILTSLRKLERVR